MVILSTASPNMSTPTGSSSEKPSSPGPGVVSTGWLAAESTYGQPDEGWVKRLSGASGVSLLLHVVAITFIAFMLGVPQQLLQEETPPLKADLLVMLQKPGPGGGGGGSPAPAPPKPMEIPKVKAPDPIPVVVPPPPVTPPPPVPQLNAPIVTPNATVIQAPGVSSVSLTNFGGGGRGDGVGRGTGNGVGEGTGGGFGGGVYGPGSGATDPVVLFKADPKYTSEAMRAKIQGEVEVDAIIGPDGLVAQVLLSKSLDRTHGLDQEALKAARLWRFQPARFQGKPVAMRVTLILEFRLH